jgi:uncharacterized protein (DUF58 family)
VSRSVQVALLGLALTAVAGAFAISALYVPGVALVLTALVAEGTVRLAARRAEIEIELAPRSVEEGHPARLRVRAAGWPFLLSRAELRALPQAAPEAVRIGGVVRELELRPRRRGEHTVGPSALRFADPFGICERHRHSATARMLVLPRLERVRREQLELLLGLARARLLSDDGPDVEGLRPYRPGAPASRIHWLTVARTGVLLERRAEQDAEGTPHLIVLDSSRPASAEALDSAVRAAASLCVAIAATGSCSLLLPGSHQTQTVRADLSSWPHLHARLAAVEESSPPSWSAVRRAPLVIWVSARAPEPRAAEMGASCTVSPLAREDRRVIFELSGCAVQSSADAVRSMR